MHTPLPPVPVGPPPGLPGPLLQLMDRARGGQGGILLLSGSGRAHRAELLRAAEQEATKAGFETVRLRAHPLDRGVPYGALQPWLSQWYRAHGAGRSGRDRPGGGGPAYAVPLVGLLAGLPSLEEEPGEGGRGTDRLAATVASSPSSSALPPMGSQLSPALLRAELTDLVEGRGRERPALVTIEDAEFLDAASRRWFSFLAPRMARLPIAMLLAVELDDPHHATWEEHLKSPPALLCRLPRDPAPGGPGSAARLASFPPRTLEALLAVVLAGPDASHQVVRAVAQLSDPDLYLALSPAMDAGLVERSEGRYLTLEPSLYPDLLGRGKPPQLVATHRALARELESRSEGGGALRGPLLFRVSEHWSQAHEVGRGIPTLQAAAREAERLGSPELAEEKLLAAIVLTQTDPTTHGREVEERVLAELAVLRFRAGKFPECVEAYRRAIALAKERGARAVVWARYECGLADVESRTGGHPEERLRATLEQVRGRSSDVEAMVLRSLTAICLDRGRNKEATELGEQACVLADKGRDGYLRVRCHSTTASTYIFSDSGPERAKYHLEKALENEKALEGTPEKGALVNVLDGLATVECGLGNEPEALRRGEESLRAAREYGFGTSLLLVLGNLPEHYVHTRDFDRAQELVDEGRWHIDRLGLNEVDGSRCQLVLIEGRIAAGRGENAVAREKFTRLCELSDKGAGRYFLGQALVHLIVLSARTGDKEAARRYQRRLEREGLVKLLVSENRRLLQEVAPLLGPDPGPGGS